MKRLFLALLFSLIANAALSQNVLCPTRSAGDSSNACASTAFVLQNGASSATLDALFGSTRGSILERGAAAWQIIVPGTSGLPFVSNGTGADPAYQLLSGSGIVANPVITGSVTANSLIASTLDGGTTASSQLLIESTTAVSTSDSIVLNTGNHVTRQKIFSDGSLLIGPGISSLGVDTYGGGSNTGKAAFEIINQDNTALTATEHYAGWIAANSQGTGDSTPAGTSFALGLSAIKTNWPTTTIVGEYVALNVVSRGGHNNAVASGDTGGITINTAASFSNNFVTQIEGVSGYFPVGSTTGSLFINAQVGSIKATGLDTGSNTGVGFFAQAQNGLVGHAFSASNLGTNGTAKFGTASKWLTFLNYLYDDGTHTPYVAFNVSQSGALTLAGFGTAGTNQKTIRVGVGATNNLEIVNAGNTAQILTLTDGGQLNVNGTLVSGAAGFGTGILQLTGTTSGAATVSGSATGGHITYTSSSTPTNNACTGFALATGSDDIVGRVTFTSATSCAINFGTAFANAPFCVISPGSAASTVEAATTTAVLTATFGTAQTAMSWICYGG